MPSKSQRAASRQASLRKKRRHGKGAAQAFEVGPTQSSRVAEEGKEEIRAVPQPAPAPVQAQPSGRAKQAAVAEAASQDQFLGAEVRRIGIVTAIILALLAVASMVLGG